MNATATPITTTPKQRVEKELADLVHNAERLAAFIETQDNNLNLGRPLTVDSLQLTLLRTQYHLQRALIQTLQTRLDYWLD